MIFCCALNGKYTALYTNSIGSILLCIQIVLLFHLSERFSYLNTPWSQHVRISDFQLYIYTTSANAVMLVWGSLRLAPTRPCLVERSANGQVLLTRHWISKIAVLSSSACLNYARSPLLISISFPVAPSINLYKPLSYDSLAKRD